MRRLSAFFGPWSALAPAVALAGGLAWFWIGREMAPYDAAALPSVRILAALSAAAFLGLAVASLIHRRWTGLLAGMGGLALLGYFSWWASAHFQAVLNLGVGEPSAPFEEVQKGPFGRPPQVAVGVLEAPKDGVAEFQVGLDDRTVPLALGRSVSHHGYRYRFVSAHHAPNFTLETEAGASIDGALVKLQLGDPPDPFIQLGLLPHRFYVSRTEGEGEMDFLSAPDRLSLRVMRGKLTAWRGTIEKRKAVPFESLAFRYDDGAPWVRIEVRKGPPSFLWLAAAAALLGAAVAVR